MKPSETPRLLASFKILFEGRYPSEIFRFLSGMVSPFLDLRQKAFSDKNSFFNRFVDINDDEAVDLATNIWETINLKNLAENILPTRNRASLIVKKDVNHKIKELWLRKI